MSEQIKTPMSSKTDAEANTGHSIVYADSDAEKQYRKKVDFYVLPLLCLVRAP
jgi:hypothetical protein